MPVSNSFGKNGPASVLISYTSILPIQNNSLTHLSFFLSYKSLSLTLILESKKSTIKIEENDDVNSNVEMQPLSSQQHLKPTLQTLQEGLKLRRFKHQTQILFREGNIYRE